MKKILFLLILIYNYSFSSTVNTTLEDFMSRKSGFACSTTVSTSITWSYTSGTSYGYDAGNRLLFAKGVLTRGDDNGNNAHFTLISYTCHTPEPNEPLCVNNVDSNGALICKSPNDLNPDYFLNPENGTFGSDGKLTCDSGYSATGIALGIPACMPNPENGTWDDNDDLVCNEGYVAGANNTCTQNPDNSNDGCPTGYHSYTDVISGEKGCIPDYIPPTPDDGNGSTTGDGSGTGGTTGDGSGTGGTTGGDSGTGGTTGDGSGTGGTTGDGTDLGGVISAINKNTTENTSILTKIFDAFNSTDSSLTSDVSTKYSNTGNDFVNFYTDMKSSYNNFNSQFDTAKGIFENGFNFTPIYAVNNPNLKECLFGNREIVFDFITPLNYIKPIFSLLIQLFMLVEVVRMCFKIINYARGLF